MNKKAFTIIELLVVIVLLALIAIIMVPRVSKLVENQGKEAYDVHKKLIKTALDLYTSRHQGDFNNYNEGNCLILNYSELITDGVLKEDKVTCNGQITLTKKNNNSYDYGYYLKCVDKDNQVLEDTTGNVIPNTCTNYATTSSNDATLKRLTIETYGLNENFQSNITTYTSAVPNKVVSVNVIAETNDPNARYRVVGDKGLVVGQNTVQVIVTAPNGDTKTYEIEVRRQKGNISTLQSLSATNCTFDTPFTASTLVYNCVADNNATSTVVTAVPTEIGAKVEGTGKKNLNVGLNKLEVKVTSEDKSSTTTYVINITREANTNAFLSNLGLDACHIEFNKNTYNYSCTVLNSVTKVAVTATTEETVAKVESGLGEHNLVVGNNEIKVITKAEDNITSQTYTINVNRLPNDDTELKSLAATNCTLSPTFKSTTTSYTCTVPYSVSSTTVTGQTNNSLSTVEGLGNYNLVVGENQIKVTVTAQSGNKLEYVIRIKRSEDTDNTLATLEVEGYSLRPAFNKDTLVYDVDVEEEQINIIGRVTSGVAHFVGTGRKAVPWGDKNFTVIVSAQDGTTRNYTIRVHNIKPQPPVIQGGNSIWTADDVTISVKTSGTALSGVKYYEYYLSTSNPTPPSTTVKPTGTSATMSETNGNIVLSINGIKNSSGTFNTAVPIEGIKYVWYRTVSNHYTRSAWSNMQTVYYVKRAVKIGYDNSKNNNTCSDVQCALDDLARKIK